MKGMNLQEQKKCGILVTVIGLVMFAIGFLLGDAHMGDFYSGLGCGLFVCGAVRLLRVYRLSRDPEKAADYDAMLKDERTMYVANKARSMTFFICVYAQLAAGLLALLVFKQPIIGQVLCLVTCAQSLIFCGTYWYYNCGDAAKGDILFLGKRISPLHPQEKGRGESPSTPDIAGLGLEELLSLRNQVRCTWLRHESSAIRYVLQPRLTIVRRE
ncbi:MAG: hypothetical protein BHW32_04625 [Firmicutes bacterium CAG:129_59_24]|nr:MAG: hypothetical protein BHW32_04625 [Firmicutes bacterium CAG:129_59_24]